MVERGEGGRDCDSTALPSWEDDDEARSKMRNKKKLNYGQEPFRFALFCVWTSVIMPNLMCNYGEKVAERGARRRPASFRFRLLSTLEGVGVSFRVYCLGGD
jgi:hypothetical protein